VDSLALAEDQTPAEAVYSEQLLQRCLDRNVDLDRLFVGRYQEVTSPAKVIRFRSILKDYDESERIVGDFTTPPFLTIVVSSAAFWRVVEVPLIWPEQIRGSLTSFSEFYMAHFVGRRISWDATLSTAELECDGSPFRCDAVIGAFLLAIVRGKGVHTLGALAIELGLETSVLESIIRLLKSSRLGEVIVVRDSIVSLNPALSIPSSLVIPSAGKKTRPASIQKAELPGFMSEGSQIDAVVVRILKEKTSINFTELLADCVNLLRFTVSRDVLLDRIKRLETRRFLMQDVSGGWRYLP
jgi:hypothetical protein